MQVTITDVYHNGKNWVANIVTSEGKGTELNITDAQADELKKVGTPIYDPDAD